MAAASGRRKLCRLRTPADGDQPSGDQRVQRWFCRHGARWQFQTKRVWHLRPGRQRLGILRGWSFWRAEHEMDDGGFVGGFLERGAVHFEPRARRREQALRSSRIPLCAGGELMTGEDCVPADYESGSGKDGLLPADRRAAILSKRIKSQGSVSHRRILLLGFKKGKK